MDAQYWHALMNIWWCIQLYNLYNWEQQEMHSTEMNMSPDWRDWSNKDMDHLMIDWCLWESSETMVNDVHVHPIKFPEKNATHSKGPSWPSHLSFDLGQWSNLGRLLGYRPCIDLIIHHPSLAPLLQSLQSDLDTGMLRSDGCRMAVGWLSDVHLSITANCGDLMIHDK